MVKKRKHGINSAKQLPDYAKSLKNKKREEVEKFFRKLFWKKIK